MCIVLIDQDAWEVKIAEDWEIIEIKLRANHHQVSVEVSIKSAEEIGNVTGIQTISFSLVILRG